MPNTMVQLALLLTTFWSVTTHAQMPQHPDTPGPSCRTGIHEYRVSRQGDSKGLLSVNIFLEGSRCRIEVKEWLEDTHYCHQIYRREIWQDGGLVEYLSMTKGWCGLLAKLNEPAACRWNADGSPVEVAAQRIGDQIEVRGRAHTGSYYPGLATMTFLAPPYPVASGTIPLIDPFDGAVTDAQVTELGGGKDGIKTYKLVNDRMWTLVYDRQQMLSQLILDGGIGGDVNFDLLASGAEPPVAKAPNCRAVFRPLQVR